MQALADWQKMFGAAKRSPGAAKRSPWCRQTLAFGHTIKRFTIHKINCVLDL
jgi:hypothetical protein